MKMRTPLRFLFCGLLMGITSTTFAKTFYAESFGIVPEGTFTAENVAQMMEAIRASQEENTLVFKPGHYFLNDTHTQKRHWFISNHDQTNPRRVFLPIEKQTHLHVVAEGVTFESEVSMIFAGIWESSRITLRGFSCDTRYPFIAQLTLTAVDPDARTVTFRPLPEVVLSHKGPGQPLVVETPDARFTPTFGTLFEADGKIAYRTSDFGFSLKNVTQNPDGTYTTHNFSHPALRVGQQMAVRPGLRPAPGIVVSDAKDIRLEGLTIYSADGMGVLCQSTENIDLQDIAIVPNRAKGRVFSTQADATHFSGCKGEIFSLRGTYIGMMDDAINVHGTYLRLTKRIDAHTLEGRYMHHQAYGFTWGESGDTVTFIQSRPMQALPDAENTLTSITPIDQATTQAGAKLFRLTFKDPLPEAIDPEKEPIGIENLTWTPSVFFAQNIIANNRARGALFSTPRPVRCVYNRFDHVSGCGVLLCGDCNGWYETGACKDVLIAHNLFINNLTSRFQFTEAIISICPEIPALNQQETPLHKNIKIFNNIFETFDTPIVYAKSVDGLMIENNVIVPTTDYPPYLRHPWLRTERCQNVKATPPKQQ